MSARRVVQVSPAAVDWKLRRKIHREQVQARVDRPPTTVSATDPPRTANRVRAAAASRILPPLAMPLRIGATILIAGASFLLLRTKYASDTSIAASARTGSDAANGGAVIDGAATHACPPAKAAPQLQPTVVHERSAKTYPEFVRKYVK